MRSARGRTHLCYHRDGHVPSVTNPWRRDTPELRHHPQRTALNLFADEWIRRDEDVCGRQRPGLRRRHGEGHFWCWRTAGRSSSWAKTPRFPRGAQLWYTAGARLVRAAFSLVWHARKGQRLRLRLRAPNAAHVLAARPKTSRSRSPNVTPCDRAGSSGTSRGR
jgi:hypothetical protein